MEEFPPGENRSVWLWVETKEAKNPFPVENILYFNLLASFPSNVFLNQAHSESL